MAWEIESRDKSSITLTDGYRSTTLCPTGIFCEDADVEIDGEIVTVKNKCSNAEAKYDLTNVVACGPKTI